MALGEDLAMPAIHAACAGQAAAVADAWDHATRDELAWMATVERTAAMMVPLSPLTGADWSRDWLSFASLLMICEAVHSNSETHLGYAERAVRALHQRFGTPVLSPEPSLGLQYDECEGVVMLDVVSPKHRDAARRYGAMLATHIAQLLASQVAGSAQVEHLAGCRIIGTLAEWQAVATTMTPDDRGAVVMDAESSGYPGG
jgi:hypothetical protein